MTVRSVFLVVALSVSTLYGRVQSTSAPLIVVDVSQGDDARERFTALARAIAPEAELRIWTGLGDHPATRYRLSFTEAFDIYRGHATQLQTVKSRECFDASPSCAADLPLRARQTLDVFDALARATIKELATIVSELGSRDEPRPHSVVFVTTGLLYRIEPKRDLEALKASARRSAVVLSIVDGSGGGRVPPAVTRLSAAIGATAYVASDDGLGNLRSTLVAADTVTSRGGSAPWTRSGRIPSEVEIASRHAVMFAENAETLLADEHYVQEVKTRPSATSMPQYSTAGITIEKRQIDSEVALVQVKSGELWLLARDVQMVDDRPIDPSQRIPLPAVHAGSDAEALQRLRDIAKQGARFNIGGIRRDLNVPTLALWLLTPAVVPRFEFTVGGTETIDGRGAVVVQFKERKAPYLFTVDDEPAPTSGRFWLDRARGAVIRTELILRSAVERARGQAQIVVNYRFDTKAEAWVPHDMTERYNAALTSQFVVANATYSNVRRFSSTIRIVK